MIQKPPRSKFVPRSRDDYRPDKRDRFDRPARPSRPKREGDFTERPGRPARPKTEFTPKKDNEKKYSDERPYKTSRFPSKRNEEQTERPRRFPPKRNEEQTERPRRFPPKRNEEQTERPRRFPPKRNEEQTERPSRFPPKRNEEQTERPRRFPPKRNEEQTERPRYSRRYQSDDSPAERPRRFRAPEPEKKRNVTLRPRKSKQVDDFKPHDKARDTQELVNTETRLNKFIANSGVCSRREADEYIAAGLVTVNGEVVTQMGSKIKHSDDIRFNGERLQGEEKVYILMNKPKDFVTTTDDPNAEQTVMDIIAGKCAQRVYPVGRLDKSTTGVLLLTNDGALTKQLTHPSYNRKKIYQVNLNKNLNKTDLEVLVSGVELEDGPAHVDEISYIDEDESKVGVEIHSGRNRIIRRMFEHLGYSVKKLDRVYFAGLTKKNLRRGAWRFLSPKEVAMLKMGAYE